MLSGGHSDLGANMARPTVAELQEIARSVFGREITEAQAEAYGGRLPTMARIVKKIRELEPQLGRTDPIEVADIPDTRSSD